jgi:hypothetical protein
MTDERRPDDLPPMGWLSGPDAAGAMAFRRHHEQLRSFARAATAMQYGGIVLPYHYDILAVARSFLTAGMPDIAVIMAQTAWEVATEELLSQLLRYENLPTKVAAWIRKRIGRGSTFKNDAYYGLYLALSGDKLKENEQALWQAYKASVDVRNKIIHEGSHASEEQAKTACDIADKLIHHFEGVLTRVTAK